MFGFIVNEEIILCHDGINNFAILPDVHDQSKRMDAIASMFASSALTVTQGIGLPC